MKVCLSTNCDYNYLKNADEIRFKYKDRKGIEKFAERYSNATIVLHHNALEDDEIDWKFLKEVQILIRRDIILCVNSIQNMKEATDNGFKVYLNHPITSYYELDGILKLEPCYIILGAPLFFDLTLVKRKTDVPIRAIPNVAYMDGFPREDGVLGTWIRPESLGAYEGYIDIIEFADCELNKDKEQALYRLYIKGEEWPGPLEDLITNLNHSGENRMLSSEFLSARIDCGQACLTRGKNCHICERSLDLANPELIQEYIDWKENK